MPLPRIQLDQPHLFPGQAHHKYLWIDLVGKHSLHLDTFPFSILFFLFVNLFECLAKMQVASVASGYYSWKDVGHSGCHLYVPNWFLSTPILSILGGGKGSVFK